MISVLLGLSAAICYGAADFLGGLATKRSSMLSVAIAGQAAGFGLLLLVLPFFPGNPHSADLLWGAAAGVCGGLGIALLYRALAIGKMGVVSPITAVLAAALPVVTGFVRGEQLASWQVAGIVLALVAIVMVSFSGDAHDGSRGFSMLGVKEAVGSGVVLGGFYVFLANARHAAGLDELVAARFASTVFLLVVAVGTGASIRLRGNVLRVVLLSGALDMSANVLYLLATYAGYLSVAAVLTSLYPASTVFLARIVLKERLSRSQLAGVALALAGVALIAA